MNRTFPTGTFAILKYYLYYRDIKPENFMLKTKGDTSCIKLIDFGLSKDYTS